MSLITGKKRSEAACMQAASSVTEDSVFVETSVKLSTEHDCIARRVDTKIIHVH